MHRNGAGQEEKRRGTKKEGEEREPEEAPWAVCMLRPHKATIGPANSCVPAPCLHQTLPPLGDERGSPKSAFSLPHLQPPLHLTSTRTHAPCLFCLPCLAPCFAIFTVPDSALLLFCCLFPLPSSLFSLHHLLSFSPLYTLPLCSLAFSVLLFVFPFSRPPLLSLIGHLTGALNCDAADTPAGWDQGGYRPKWTGQHQKNGRE